MAPPTISVCDLVAEQDPVAAQHVPRVDGDRPRLAIARANITRADAAFAVTRSSGELSGKQQARPGKGTTSCSNQLLAI
jgi:hypothetical protein